MYRPRKPAGRDVAATLAFLESTKPDDAAVVDPAKRVCVRRPRTREVGRTLPLVFPDSAGNQRLPTLFLTRTEDENSSRI